MPARPEPFDRPLVVAHRGASADQAEHTLAAYVRAIEQGADALECDVRLTRDGHLVCVHDRRIDRTSDGQGPVSELDLLRLRELDFASWHEETARWPETADALVGDQPYLSGVAPDRLDEHGRVLTLDRLMQLAADCGRPVGLYVETKHPTRYGGMVEKELVRLLARFGWDGRRRAEPDRVTVMSFAPVALRRVRLLAPDLPTVLLFDRRRLRDRSPRGSAVPGGVTIAGPGLSYLRIDPDLVERSHARGHRVYTWVVDEPAELDFVRSLGVDSIGTNRPDRIRRHLGLTA